MSFKKNNILLNSINSTLLLTTSAGFGMTAIKSSLQVYVRIPRLLPPTLIVICMFHGQSDVSDPNTGPLPKLAGAQPVISVSGL